MSPVTRTPKPASTNTTRAANTSARLLARTPRPANNSGLKPAVMIASALADKTDPFTKFARLAKSSAECQKPSTRSADCGKKKHHMSRSTDSTPTLARRLGLFDATMIVMGGIIGSGIFMNPAVGARQVHTPFLILAAWTIRGLFALAAGFIWAELAARRPDVGGQYAYLREAFHPAVAFLYGWVLLLVVQTGGMAAVAVTFARYFVELTNVPINYATLAAVVLAILTIINCLGVRAGSTVQSILMVLKIAALLALVICGLVLTKPATNPSQLLDRPASFGMLTAFGAALVPVIFSYGGWQTATFVAGEIKEPDRKS